MAEEVSKNKAKRSSMTLGRILSRISGKNTMTDSPPPVPPPLEVPHLSMPTHARGEEGNTAEDEEDTGSSLSSERKLTRRGSWTTILSPGKSPKGSAMPEGPMVLSLNPADPVASIHNDDAIVKKIASRLRRGASSMDGQGSIYIYRKHDEAGFPTYRKITCVPKVPEQSLDLTLVLRIRCKRPRHAQVLIHLLADRVRVKRYYMNTEGTMLTVNRRTGMFVQDAAYAKEGKVSVMGRRYSEDWFMADEAVLLRVAASVVQDVNNHWIGEPWEETM